ncbi:hypothetical protein [Sicyoidochytrium minutum DNA virus]|nr:hypothetical protein [Sicyoidochytrium minutum DNA virus]
MPWSVSEGDNEGNTWIWTGVIVAFVVGLIIVMLVVFTGSNSPTNSGSGGGDKPEVDQSVSPGIFAGIAVMIVIIFTTIMLLIIRPKLVHKRTDTEDYAYSLGVRAGMAQMDNVYKSASSTATTGPVISVLDPAMVPRDVGERFASLLRTHPKEAERLRKQYQTGAKSILSPHKKVTAGAAARKLLKKLPTPKSIVKKRPSDLATFFNDRQ